MLSVIFLLIMLLSVGSMLIFVRLTEHMVTLRVGSEENKLYNEIDRNIGDLVDAVKGWGLTGEVKYRKNYFKKLSDVRRNFGELSTVHTDKEELAFLGREFETVTELSGLVIRKQQPVGSPEVTRNIQQMDSVAIDIIKADRRDARTLKQ